ncbi:sigma-E processing peptidase SpoIIGA [Tissierella creatinophila]|uniref:Sporulation sigma-E factor-processing peptidase n=1 Tax=Tissierella creatinophila DSM 6911 TaxID=1123403 RepID=A0A1U7M9H0_TISCR|nr:sigma-E processing peptidase SpoIIGA [Tissierella creatinophila]OLS03890.1 sporulation sigma-E factor-processing peptidase [Tissierella creatinophila DSM 6911]
MYIVLEYYLLENLIINFLILYSTKTITKNKTPIKNIIIGTLFGTVYSLVFFYPSLLFLTRPMMKFILSLIIVKISFKSKTLKSFYYEFLGFYIISFIFAGVIIGMSWNFKLPSSLLQRGYLLDMFNIKNVIIGIIIAIFMVKIVFNYTHRKNMKKEYIYDVEIYFKDKFTKVTALVDTGNSLVDPFSRTPVFVVELEKIDEFIPTKIKDIVVSLSKNSIISFQDILDDLNKEFPLIPIPFKSIGNEGGIILGFKPDYIIIKSLKEEILKKDIIIGIYNGKLSDEMEYDGLLHYETIF